MRFIRASAILSICSKQLSPKYNHTGFIAEELGVAAPDLLGFGEIVGYVVFQERRAGAFEVVQ
jgi:hypothetical protein